MPAKDCAAKEKPWPPPYTSLPFVTHLSSQVMMPIRFDFPPNRS